MADKIFNSLEMDAIGEILNISLGASATAVSTMLDRRVDITVPTVMVSSKESFEFTYMEPAVAVEITYVTGLSGNNIMLLKRHDVKVIVEILMGSEIPEEEFELNDINMSAIREVMNQMMGSSSTALAELLGEPVNISTPTSFEINTVAEFAEKYLLDDQPMVVVRFSLKVEDSLESEFLNIMTVDLARKLLSCFGLPIGDLPDDSQDAVPEPPAPAVETQEMNYQNFQESEPEEKSSSGGMMSQEEIEKLMSQSFQSATPGDTQPEPAKTPSAESSSGGKLSQEEIEKLLSQSFQSNTPVTQPEPVKTEVSQNNVVAPVVENTPARPAPQPSYAPQQSYAPGANTSPAQPKVINVKPNADLNRGESLLDQERKENLDLIMGVPLEISVEIGRTKKNVREILEYNKGSLIVLDKLAGEQVDIYVNGQCIAKGDVVVVDDNFGVRVTEVLKKI
ncbi:flagellar motor switch protein FliN [Anaerotignum propionicum]|uniref:Flagellar motor switch protein FliN n=1 Tax=Anaerotignum propionicum DSM 1682 TaxID=991789 RepID=A0A0X8VCF7_ANAPI|nr:flagellar motor switch protein FliN [Anaerotignum propionicum]AMJ42388.1 flagellar motor switch protein FliN [Anaerotignum propionicum DSM 1682]SHF00975.1 flagellar motor switch protein FliN/FliY [[Clostridium] propionicum DSM 1682] [Anaerotignum propionicum DSM 1682]